MEIKIINSDNEMKDAYHVRTQVFVEEQGVPKELEIDDLEKEAMHFIGYIDGEPVAASRMRFVDGYAKLERVCILDRFRGQGYGKEIIFFMEKIAKEKGLGKSKLNGQTHAEEFYLHLGYQTISGEFMDAGIPHVTMTKSLL
ncbi:GNAT family acetyltransferase YjcF [Gracilibacillus boraciitolerans JCM 21714]|uniref:GNAT family acetyltransferase YjcF n=1 Tax=Gracilibacillus boraciitolerans JCM 21714 TaxID=1298598 RepID=W4VM38_9BACI|nr:GNAT family N-acetyltransferase [Gracilibacillus boraciitolerans]GAE94272.1 GNAT family acetyltransferase YjcF [Gracilibacillus boraciitolerans JCM 21714]